MFERGWTLYLSGAREQALAVFGHALERAEHAAGAPNGDRRLRVYPRPGLETYVVGDRVLVSTPFFVLVAEPSAGRVERVVRGSLHSPQVIRGTSLVAEQIGFAGTRIFDGRTLASIVSWDGWTLVHPSADGALLAVAVAIPGHGDGSDLNKIVIFDTRERREIVQFTVPEIRGFRIADDGRIVVNGSEVRDAHSARILFSQADELGSPAFSTSHVAFATPDGAVALAERDTWRRIATTRECANATALSFDASGKVLAIGGADAACLVDVPSLKKRHSFVARRLPIYQHPELEATLRNRTIPTFLGNGRVLALESSRTYEVSLFDVTTGRLLSRDVGELYVPEHSDAYVITDQRPPEMVTVGATGTVERRTIAPGERPNPPREDAPAADVIERIRANLCMLDWGMIDWGRGMPAKTGFWIVPREACDR
jgi:hypothetical protein